MKVAMVNLTAGGLSGGYRKYLYKLLPLLQSDRRISKLDVFIHPRARINFGLNGREFLYWPETDSLLGFRWLRSKIVSLESDVVFIPTARFLKLLSIPCVSMIRNMEALTIPWGNNRFDKVLKNLLRRFAARRAVRLSDRIIAVSNYVAEFLTNRWRVDPSRIGVVPHGTELPLRISETCRPACVELNRAFLFTVGSLMPYRQLEDIIMALTLPPLHQTSIQVLIAGEASSDSGGYMNRLSSLVRNNNLGKRVVFAGQLQEKELSWCYYHCEAFVMTSRVEACPNVVLEALAHGCVAVSTNSPPMPEFFRDAAIYYTPGDSRELAARVAEVVSDRNRREELSHQSSIRALDYTWEATAKKTVSELEFACELRRLPKIV